MDLVPKQKMGKQYDNTDTVICTNSLDAKGKYLDACTKLFKINEWGKIGNTLLQTEFCLCNNKGKEVTRHARTGDFIRINLAGPCSKNGDGFNWVQIDQIVIKTEENDSELTSVKVRPAACPLNGSTAIAYFFNEESTTTFIVSKIKNEVSAEIHVRNKESNKNTSQPADFIRNIALAKLAAVKFSAIQWKRLCEGFLD